VKKLIALISGLVIAASLGFVLAGCGADETAKSAGEAPAAGSSEPADTNVETEETTTA
jgi:hypothetical protein